MTESFFRNVVFKASFLRCRRHCFRLQTIGAIKWIIVFECQKPLKLEAALSQHILFKTFIVPHFRIGIGSVMYEYSR